jgi:hypothetical protein
MAYITGNTANRIDLALNWNPAYVPLTDDEFGMNPGDMSQLGLKRGKLLPEQWIPLFNDLTITVTDQTIIKHAFIKKCFVDPTSIADATEIAFHLDSSALAGYDVNKQQVAELQEALRPKTGDAVKAVINDERMSAFVAKVRAKVPIDSAIFASFLTSIVSTNVALRDFLSGHDIIESEEATIVTAISVDPSKIEDCSYADLLSIKSKCPPFPETTQKAYNDLEFLSMFDKFGFSEALTSHPVVDTFFRQLYAEHMTKVYEPPSWMPKFVKAGNSYNLVTITAVVTKPGIPGDNNAPPPAAVTKIAELKQDNVVKELLLFASMHKHTTHALAEHNYEVAFARMLVLRHSLHAGSTEKCLFNISNGLVFDLPALQFFLTTLRKPEPIYSGLFTSVLSFLKSGHHANAFNIDRWYMRILDSLGTSIDLTRSARMVNSVVYYGSHPAYMLLLCNYLYHRSKAENMTGAITYRMFPVPPMFSGLCNLELFMDALQATGFFELMSKGDEYTEFKTHMSTIRSSMHLCAPYAHYLYGQSQDQPVESKNLAAKYASYATAIDAVLPNGTLNLSPSLRKLAENQGRNAIAANLQVEAFVKAYRQYHATLIEGKMRASVAVPRRISD